MQFKIQVSTLKKISILSSSSISIDTQVMDGIVRFLKSLELCTWTLDACEHSASRSFYGSKVSKVALDSFDDDLSEGAWVDRSGIPNLWLFKSLEINQQKLSDRKVRASARINYEHSNVISGWNGCHHPTEPKDRENMSSDEIKTKKRRHFVDLHSIVYWIWILIHFFNI